MREVYITLALRTPFGKMLGQLSDISTIDIGITLVENILKCIDKDTIDLLIVGNAISCGLGANFARQIVLKSNLSNSTSAYIINQVCGSGMRAVFNAYDSIASNNNNNIIALGVENMSQAPHIVKGLRLGKKKGDYSLIDTINADALTENSISLLMGEIVEIMSQKRCISRKEQDEFALLSQTRTQEALEKGFFLNEIVPIYDKKGNCISEDELPRKNQSLEILSKLVPAFTKNGSLTSGNSSQLSDGGAALLLTNDKTRFTNAFRIIGYNCFSCSPMDFAIAPAYSIQELLCKNHLSINDIDLFEINEAFAAQVIAVCNILHISYERVNISGGTLAIGHPLGASGIRIIVTLINNLIKTNKTLGIASLCVAGGMGLSILIERC